MSSLAAPARNLLGFSRLLRGAGFSVAPEQVTAFMHAVTLLGPRSMDDIREAALATLAPPPDTFGEFDALFRAWFWGDSEVIAPGEGDEDVRAKDDEGQRDEPAGVRRRGKGGEHASAAERLALRRFLLDDDQLSAFGNALLKALPVRRSFRGVRTRSRGRPDVRRALRAIVATDGDIPTPPLWRRLEMPRRLLVLIDISGSMRQHTDANLKLAYAIVQRAARAEIFTIGTRLTRITRSLQGRHRERALLRVGELVEDWDGGTRIGPTLLAFLGVPRFAALARGAAIVILSDGLERGSHAEMQTALRRLSARAFRLSLCTPLAADPRFRPDTAALRAVLPLLDDLADGGSLESLTRFILSLAHSAPPARNVWRKVS